MENVEQETKKMEDAITNIACALGENVQFFWNMEKEDDEVKITIVRSPERRPIIHFKEHTHE